MATQTIRQHETQSIPGISRKNIERFGDFITALGEFLGPYLCAPFVAYAEGQRPESISPMEKAGIDAYRWEIHLP